MAVLARFYDINIRNLALKKYIQRIDLRAKASQFLYGKSEPLSLIKKIAAELIFRRKTCMH